MLFAYAFSTVFNEEIAKFLEDKTIFNEGRPFVERGDVFVEYVLSTKSGCTTGFKGYFGAVAEGLRASLGPHHRVEGLCRVQDQGFGIQGLGFNLGHFQVGSYRYRSLIEGLYTNPKPQTPNPKP